MTPLARLVTSHYARGSPMQAGRPRDATAAGGPDQDGALAVCDSPTGRYYAALHDEQDAFDDALAAIRAEQASGRITAAEAAAEREGLMKAHLGRLARLRAEHLGEPS